MPEISEEELARLKADSEDKKALEASKTRLEEENAKIKKSRQEMETKLTDAEKSKLEEDGKINELLAQERKEKLELEEKYKNRGKATLKEKLRSEVSKFAKDAHDVDDLLSISSKEVKELLKINEDELTVSGVEEFVKKARELKPHYFGTKRMGDDFNNKKPGKEEEDDDTTKSKEELYRAELKTVTTRKELLAVKKKYGKQVDSYLGNI